MQSRSTIAQKLAKVLLTAAATESGTWSMDNYNRLVSEIKTFKSKDAAEFIQLIMQKILDSDTTPLMRFKLAQLCSIINSMSLSTFSGKFFAYQDKIRELCQKIGDGKLGSSTIHHLLGIISASERGSDPATSTPPSTMPVDQCSSILHGSSSLAD